MSEGCGPLVRVRFGAVGDPEADHAALRLFAEQVTGPVEGDGCTDPHLEHLCPTCGSRSHGRPLITGGAAVSVSLSRADGVLALAATAGAIPLGIDIESLPAVQRAGFDDVAFGHHERGELADAETRFGPNAAARLRVLGWTAKEALLKAAGIGLRADPRGLRVTWSGPGSVGLVASTLPHVRVSAAHLVTVDGPGVIGTIATLTAHPPRLATC